MRLTEPLNLRIKDADLEGAVLFIRGAKGGKDRGVALPACLKAEMVRQGEAASAVWRQNARNRVPLEIPHQLAHKYPEHQFAWPWGWLFPARQPCRPPRTGQIVRYRMHEAHVQRAIKEARRKLGIMILPRELRHAYATHCLEQGANPRAIQEAMGTDPCFVT